ncbi:MAG: amidohydrolase family protein [Pseudonocardiaceae bacterium]
MFAIKAGRAFDGAQQIPGGATVLIDDGRIAWVAPAVAPLPDGCPVTEFPHATVLPGLIDTHVHLGGDGRDGALKRLADYPDAELAQVIEAALRRHLSAGVTTVRDLGDRRWSVVQRRDRATDSSAGEPSPTIVASGPPITSIRGHCWYLGGEAQGSAALRGAIRERAERRVDVVKIMASGGVHTTGTDVMSCQFSPGDLRLLVDEAHTAGLPVTAHAHGLAAIEQAVEAGVNGIEHCNCLTPAGVSTPDSLLRRLTERGIAVCPTVVARVAEARPSETELAFTRRFGLSRDAVRKHVGRMHRAGVKIVTGTDGGISAAKSHGIVPAAISTLVASGISAADALASATSIAAQVCGLGSSKGRLRSGYDADLLLIDGDPLDDVGVLTRPVAVMVRGRWAVEWSAAERAGLGQP